MHPVLSNLGRLAAVMALGSCAAAFAAPTTLFGVAGVGEEPAGGSATECSGSGICDVPATVQAARTAFLGGVNNALFEEFRIQQPGITVVPGTFLEGAPPPLSIFHDGSASKGTLTGSTGQVRVNPIDSGGSSTFLGRFDATLGKGTGWFDTNGSFSIALTGLTDIKAFGMYLTDYGDDQAIVDITLKSNGQVVGTSRVGPLVSDAPGAPSTTNASVLFFGLYNDVAFDSIEFAVDQCGVIVDDEGDPVRPCKGDVAFGGDYIGFDGLIVAQLGSTPPVDVPAPATLGLVALGLWAASRRRRTG